MIWLRKTEGLYGRGDHWWESSYQGLSLIVYKDGTWEAWNRHEKRVLHGKATGVATAKKALWQVLESLEPCAIEALDAAGSPFVIVPGT